MVLSTGSLAPGTWTARQIHPSAEETGEILWRQVVPMAEVDYCAVCRQMRAFSGHGSEYSY